MKNVIFICSGNTCRSPMAEALFKFELEKNRISGYSAESAGLFCHYQASASPNSVAALNELGIDLTEHQSNPVNSEKISSSYKIIALTENIANHLKILFPEYSSKIYTLKFFLIGKNGDVSDPFGGDIDEYRDCRDEIYNCIKNIIHSIKLGGF